MKLNDNKESQNIGNAVSEISTINNTWKNNFTYIHPIRNTFVFNEPKVAVEALKYIFWRLSRNSSHKEHMSFLKSFFIIKGENSIASMKIANSMRQYKSSWSKSVYALLKTEKDELLSEDEMLKV